MRLRTLHPKYLDTKGLIALRRETLLAKNVLLGNTIGYRNHPQLTRFKNQKSESILFIDTYLRNIYLEAEYRGYNFDKTKFGNIFIEKKINVTDGQVAYERKHLMNKLKERSIHKYTEYSGQNTSKIETNPIFTMVTGEIEQWEII